MTTKNGQTIEYLCNVFGGNSELIERLNDVSLRDLDLGIQDWTNTAITDSWTGDATTEKGIFAPVAYGLLNSGGVDFYEIDLRFHVYFQTIMQGIVDYLNVTLSSNFFDTCPFWLKTVNVFGCGGKLQKSSTYNWSGTVINTTTQILTVTIPSYSGVFINTISVPSGSSTLDHIHIETSEGYSVEVPYDSTLLIYVTPSLFLDVGGWIKIIGHHSSGHGLTELPIGTHVNMIMQSSDEVGTVGASFKVASALHNIKVTDWLKSIFQMFNLVSHYNSVTKVWSIEPRFGYSVLGTDYVGFYNSIENGNFTEIDLDNTEFTENYLNEFGFSEFKYKENEIFNTKVEGENTAGFKANACKAVFNDNTNELEFENKVYHDAFLIKTDLNSQGLICAFPNDFTLSDNEGLPVATFETAPLCAFVSDATTEINYKGTITTVPLLMQSNQFAQGELITLSYNDTVINYLGTDYTAKGLVSTFYPKWISSMLRYKVLNCKVNVKAINQKSDWIKVYSFGNDLYLRNSIDNYDAEKTALSDCTFFKISGVFSTDADNIFHNSVVPIYSI